MSRTPPALALAAVFVAKTATAQDRPTVSSQPPVALHPLAADYPMAPPPGTEVPRTARWARTTLLGASLGLGAPYGYFGAFLAYHPARWAQLETGGGYSVPFGPSVGFMARAGLDPGNGSLASLGLGVSVNFTNYHYVTNCAYTQTAGGPDVESCQPTGAHLTVDGTVYPLWVNLEVAGDLRSTGRFGARAGLGASVLLNPTALPEAAGCPSDPIGHVPCSLALARHDGRVFFQFYAHLDVYFLLYDGVETGRPHASLPPPSAVMGPDAPAARSR